MCVCVCVHITQCYTVKKNDIQRQFFSKFSAYL